jgi:energy-coupling factor transporter transmembrane protein EcfT
MVRGFQVTIQIIILLASMFWLSSSLSSNILVDVLNCLLGRLGSPVNRDRFPALPTVSESNWHLGGAWSFTLILPNLFSGFFFAFD